MADVITKWSDFIIVDNGLALRQQAVATGYQVAFVFAEIGEGIPSDPSDIPLMTSLVQFAQRAVVLPSSSTGSTHHLNVRIDNTDYPTAVLMREMAVYAKLIPPNNPGNIVAGSQTPVEFLAPTLYGYAYTIQGFESIPAGSEFHRIWTVGIDTKLSRSTSVVIIYDGSTVFVTHDDLDDAIKIHNADPNAHADHFSTVQYQIKLLQSQINTLMNNRGSFLGASYLGKSYMM